MFTRETHSARSAQGARQQALGLRCHLVTIPWFLSLVTASFMRGHNVIQHPLPQQDLLGHQILLGGVALCCQEAPPLAHCFLLNVSGSAWLIWLAPFFPSLSQRSLRFLPYVCKVQYSTFSSRLCPSASLFLAHGAEHGFLLFKALLHLLRTWTSSKLPGNLSAYLQLCWVWVLEKAKAPSPLPESPGTLPFSPSYSPWHPPQICKGPPLQKARTFCFPHAAPRGCPPPPQSPFSIFRPPFPPPQVRLASSPTRLPAVASSLI